MCLPDRKKSKMDAIGNSMINEHSILVYEPSFEGHFPFFLELVVRALIQAGWMVTVATDVASPVCIPENVVRVHTDRRANSSIELFQLANKLGVNNLFICCFDHILFPRKGHRFIGLDDPSVRVHGIWLRASDVFKTGIFEYISQKSVRRSRLLIRRLKKLFDKKMLGEIFVLDERLSEQQVAVGFPTVLLPDPWCSAPVETRIEARTKLGLPQDRVVFLHIGTDEKRKGLLDVLKLIQNFPAPGPLIVRTGELKPGNTGKHTNLIQELTAEDRLFCEDLDISEEEFDLYLRAADYVLLPYRSHGDSSGILSRAIGVGTPVIASDFGLIGKRVKELKLGILYQNNNMRDLRRAMLKAIQTPPSNFPVADASAAFSPERFVETIREKFTHYSA
jgi:glycosyltransferase involved in cell wall biosynthesis